MHIVTICGKIIYRELENYIKYNSISNMTGAISNYVNGPFSENGAFGDKKKTKRIKPKKYN